jgi:hypothetical protein
LQLSRQEGVPVAFARNDVIRHGRRGDDAARQAHAADRLRSKLPLGALAPDLELVKISRAVPGLRGVTHGVALYRELAYTPIMPRKSAASLAVVPQLPGTGRPAPPAELDTVEQRIWREVVDALPPHWIDSAGRVLLLRLVAQAALCLSMEQQLRAHRAAGTAIEEYAKLAKQHSDTAKQTESLLASLRATPRSRSTSHAAGLQSRKAAESRPWEIRGRRAETET